MTNKSSPIILIAPTPIKKIVTAAFLIFCFTLSAFSQKQQHIGVSVGGRFEKPIFFDKVREGERPLKSGLKYSLGYLWSQKKSDMYVSINFNDLEIGHIITGLVFATDIPLGTTSSIHSQIDFSSLGVDFLYSKNLFKVRKKSKIKLGIGVELNYLLDYKSSSYVLYGSSGWKENLEEFKYQFPQVNIYPILFLDYQYRLNDKYLMSLSTEGKLSVFGDTFPLYQSKANRLSCGVNLRLLRRLR